MIEPKIIGHEKQLSYLKRVVEQDRVAHALLFEGPERVGKRMAALYLARILNCRDKTACGQCPSCLKIRKLQHPDLTILEPEGQFIKIFQIRELSEFMRLRPYEGKTKVAIIDQAERMNVQASNALLKTLEDPPGHSVMILVTSNSRALLPTIRSRCQALGFNRIPEKELTDYLMRKEIDRPELRASLAEGSLSRAFNEDIDEDLLFRNKLLDQLKTLSTQRVEELFKFAETAARVKGEVEKQLICMRRLFQDKWRLTCQIDPEFIRNKDIHSELSAWDLSAREAETALWSIEQALEELKFNVAPRLLLETVLMRLPTPRL